MTVSDPSNYGSVCRRKTTSEKIVKMCSVDTLKKRIPIIQWLPKYSVTSLIQDIIAGVTVGLTSIPQGIAYAVVAGLRPEYGLYSGLLGGFVYLFFGSCKDVTVGPTAIMATMVAKYVSGYSADFAVLAAFLAGLIELAMGIFHLGFLVEFVSQPVINGFTTAAAIQIAASQLKSLFGLSGSAGNYFAESMVSFINNIQTAQLWDPILGFATIIILILLKRIGQGCKRTDCVLKQLRWFVALARNAVVVIFGIIVAYVIHLTINSEPLTLTGEIGSGLPKVKPPPFNTVVGNETYEFKDMIKVLGPESIVLPIIAILESVAIAKAFAGGASLDATQEMIALGLCNVFGSFVSSMPITGSFTRTALNNASGVQTPAGGIFTGFLVILALSLLTSTFFYIPKATLAGLIIAAMFSMIDYTIFVKLWKNSKRELFILVITMLVSLFVGLEYGIVTGILLEAILLLYSASRSSVEVKVLTNLNIDIIVVTLSDRVTYCAAEHVRRNILKASSRANMDSVIVIDGTNVKYLDTTVATNLVSVAEDLIMKSMNIVFLNFSTKIRSMCVNISPKAEYKFEESSNFLDLVDCVPKNC